MSDTSDSNGGGRSGSRFGWMRDVIDLAQVGSVVLIVLIVYFRPIVVDTTDSKDKNCQFDALVRLLSGPWNTMIPPEISVNIKKYLEKCETDPDARYVMEAVTEAVSEARIASIAPGPIVALGPTAPFSRPITASADVIGKVRTESETDTPTKPPLTGPAATQTTKPATSGWVAVGFVGDETLFGLPPGRTLQTLVVGDELTAKRPVNLRKKAADWTGPIGVVAAERKVKIVEAPKSLPAGSLTQVWARVELP